MKTLNYKSFQINIYSTHTHNFLISNKDLAEVCYVYEKLLDQIRSLNPAILLEDQHYIVLRDTTYWRKTITLRMFFALIIGFLGVVFVVKPFGIEVSIEYFLGVLGGFFAAAAYGTIKKIKNIYDARIIMLSFMSVGMLIPLGLYLFTPYVEFTFHSELFIWILIFLMALISTSSQWFLTRAYNISYASIIGVVSYSNIPFAIGFGVMLGDALPDIYTIIGIIFIVMGGILVNKKVKS